MEQSQRLAKLIGYGKTLEMVMTGEMIDAVEAKSIGLVNHVCSSEELENFTLDMANKIGSKSVFTLAAAKRTIKAALNNTLDQGIAIEAQEFANLFDSKDKEEGVKAFMERRSRSGKTVENKRLNLHPFVTSLQRAHRLR